jgi:hypothetical protein
MVKGMKILGTLIENITRKEAQMLRDLNLTNPNNTDRYVMQMFY